MKRDIELVRSILLSLEKDERMNGIECLSFKSPNDLNIKGHEDCSTEEFSYTMNLMAKEGFFIVGNMGEYFPYISGLSWKGHDFLNDVRDPEIWTKTKIRAQGVFNVGFGVLVEIAKSEIKARLGLT